MATINDLKLIETMPKELAKAIYKRDKRIEIDDILSALIAGGMAYLFYTPTATNIREFITVINDRTQPCYMGRMVKKACPSLCGKIVYLKDKYWLWKDMRHKLIEPHILLELRSYGDYNITSMNQEPFLIEGYDLIPEIFKALVVKMKERPRIVTTYSGFSLIYTEDQRDHTPVIEIHHC